MDLEETYYRIKGAVADVVSPVHSHEVVMPEKTEVYVGAPSGCHLCEREGTADDPFEISND